MSDQQRAVVVFDNTGTLSEIVLNVEVVVTDSIDTPVPDTPADHPRALVSIACEDFSVFDVESPIGPLVERLQPELHVAIANVDIATPAVRAALERDETTPAATIYAQAQAIATDIEQTHPHWTDPPVGVQVVLALDTERIERVFGYTTVPLEEGADVVDTVRKAGFDPHIVSGDATHILTAVANTVDIPLDDVHPYQSPSDKADTIRYLQESTTSPVVMVGDYLNDIQAFQAADHAIYVRDQDRTYEELVETADRVVDDLPSVVDALDHLLTL